MTDFNDVARQAAADMARQVVSGWRNKACRTLSETYIDTILRGDNTIPAGLSHMAVDPIDVIFARAGVPVREQPLIAVKVHSTSTPSAAKKGRPPAKKAKAA